MSYNFHQATINTSTGEESASERYLASDFVEFPLGSYFLSIDSFSLIYHSSSGDSATTDGTVYIFFYDKDYAFKGYYGSISIANGVNLLATSSVQTILSSNDIRYVKFRISKSNTTILPSKDYVTTAASYYILNSFDVSFTKAEWYLENDILLTDTMPKITKETIETPLPLSYWRVSDNYNNGFPYHLRLQDIEHTPPAPVWSIKPEEQIQVYEYTAAQEDLLSRNGNAVLFPESCTSRHELNGRWDITLTHKIDKHKKWEYLRYENILKVSGQLFRIDTQQTQTDYEKELITVHANHIFYDLNHRIVQKTIFTTDSEGNPVNVAPITFWGLMDERSKSYSYHLYANNYQFTRKLDNVYSDGMHEKYPDQPPTEVFNQTAVDLMIGENSFISRWGGEIYRDNFYFSLRPTIEDCKENSFWLRFPTEIRNLRYSVDINGYTTEIIIFDMNGNFAHSAWVKDGNLNHARPIVEKINIPYSASVGELVWDKARQLNTSIDVELNELKYSPKYRDKKAAVPRYHVGDKGYIMVQNKKEPYRITAVERDEITKDFISITFKKI